MKLKTIQHTNFVPVVFSKMAEPQNIGRQGRGGAILRTPARLPWGRQAQTDNCFIDQRLASERLF